MDTESDIKVLLGQVIQQGKNAETQRKDLYDKVTIMSNNMSITLSKIETIEKTLDSHDEKIQELTKTKNRAMGAVGFVTSGFLVALVALGAVVLDGFSYITDFFGANGNG